MKKVIILTALIAITNIHHTSCMEVWKRGPNTYIGNKDRSGSWSIFGLLSSWHNSEMNDNKIMCQKVEKLILYLDINQREIQSTAFRGMSPLEVATWVSNCPQCIALLKQRGALETEMSHYYEAQMKVKRMNLK